MNWRMICTLIHKDVVLFLRNRLFAPVTVFALVSYGTLYFVMPDVVDEVHEVGLYAPVIPPSFVKAMADEGVVIQEMESERALEDAMVEGKFEVGIVLLGDMIHALEAGEKGGIKVIFGSGFPKELQDAFITLLQEMIYRIKGQPMMVEASEEILGPDMTGMQIPLRDRMIPLFALFVLMTETMGLATLITEEFERRTLQALLVTPLRIEGLMLSKSITGVGLAFIQVMLLMAVIGGLRYQPVLVLSTLLLGALLVTGIGFMMASAAKDLMSVSAWGIFAMLVLLIPSFGILFPGVVSQWVKVIPSYYLVDTMHQVVNFRSGWSGVWQNLFVLFAFGAAFVWIGTMALRRRLR